ncbi:Leucine rich repeat domain protein [Oleispira antarctica RB-8]|uniref:Leucine rich repeat domain protein n=1 Tax=Oleispira antarctica RB-8 TaxID=698738 RepID=R4YRK1_OLEAN|nr:Leucine rich repeat domain protein [Oleispira antarctica RB-8]
MRTLLCLITFLFLISGCAGENNQRSDRDDDGAHDQLDQFPDDKTRAFRITGNIHNVRGDITLILNDRQITLSSDQEFLFDIAYGEAFILLAESTLEDELCVIPSPVHDGKAKVAVMTISCITRIETALVLNSITNSYLRECIKGQGSTWVDEVVELDCNNVYDFDRLCGRDGLELEFISEPITWTSSDSDCILENLDNADGIEEFVFLKKLVLKFGYDYPNSGGSTLRYIDLTKNVLLEELEVETAALDISGLDRLTNLQLAYYEGSTIDFTHSANLRNLIVFASNLETINLAPLKNLKILSIHSNKLVSVDTSMLSNLEGIIVLCRELESLDISMNYELEFIGALWTPIKELKIYNNKKLTSILLSDTNVEYIDISNNTNLIDVDFSSNKFQTVPSGIRSIKDKSVKINLIDNPLTGNAKAELAQLKKSYKNLLFDE